MLNIFAHLYYSTCCSMRYSVIHFFYNYIFSSPYVQHSVVLVIWLLLALPVAAQNVMEEYYEGGVLKMKGDSREGVKTGSWYFFYPNGEVSAVEHYEEGELHGEAVYYDTRGNVLAKENWLNGLQEDSSEYFYPNGKLEKAGVFKNGLYEGKWSFYHENGRLRKS